MLEHTSGTTTLTRVPIFQIEINFHLNSVVIILRLGAQSSYVVKYFEGSNAVKKTSMRN